MARSQFLSLKAAALPLPTDFLHAPRPARRRVRELPRDGASLTVAKPAIPEVMDTETGTHLQVSEVIGNSYEALIKLRMAVRAAQHLKRPMYVCSICQTPVFICRVPHESKFFFKHKEENGNCPSITRGHLSRDEIDALKYNGAKESALHLKMKEWLSTCLNLDPQFKDVKMESRWRGGLGTWRQPDVRATFRGQSIAFEIQLSTTYLDVIVARRQFYLQEGGLLMWVFAEFDNDHRRLTEDDVFYNNNCNAFVVNSKTVQASLDAGSFKLGCIWTTPSVGGVPGILHRKLVGFEELTLDPGQQQVYYFDYAGEVGKRQAAARDRAETLRRDFEAWWADRWRDGPPSRKWDELRPRFQLEGLSLPADYRDLETDLIVAMYSAKFNKPYGQRLKLLVQVAHRIGQAKKQHLTWFLHAVRYYQRDDTMWAEGTPGVWNAKYIRCQKEYKLDPTPFAPMRELQPFIEFLLPELAPLP